MLLLPPTSDKSLTAHSAVPAHPQYLPPTSTPSIPAFEPHHTTPDALECPEFLGPPAPLSACKSTIRECVLVMLGVCVVACVRHGVVNLL